MTTLLNSALEGCREECGKNPSVYHIKTNYLIGIYWLSVYDTVDSVMTTSQTPELCEPGSQLYQLFQRCRACIVNRYNSSGVDLASIEELLFASYCNLPREDSPLRSATPMTSTNRSSVVPINLGQSITATTFESATIRSSALDESSQAQLVTTSTTLSTSMEALFFIWSYSFSFLYIIIIQRVDKSFWLISSNRCSKLIFQRSRE